MLSLAALALLAAAADAPSDAASRQAALIDALVHVGEAARREGRLDECLRVLDAGAAVVSPRKARPSDRTRLSLQRARCAYYKASLAGSAYDDAIRELRAVVAEAEAVGAERFKSAAREALAGVDSPERKP